MQFQNNFMQRLHEAGTRLSNEIRQVDNDLFDLRMFWIERGNLQDDEDDARWAAVDQLLLAKHHIAKARKALEEGV